MIKLKPMSVSKVNHYIHNQLKLDPILNNALVVGEISNYTLHSSGHIYFSIKDDLSKINCIMFARDASSLEFEPQLGDRVEIRGNVSVYEKEGRYQINVRQMMPVGQGELHQAFMAMKKKLQLEGYFDKENFIIKYPKKIGVITSPTGAAIKDVISVLKKRHPLVEVIIYPVHVQGSKASIEIATALDYFNESCPVDTLVVCRGGGSIEDLWPFNEMMVAEAIYASRIPVISGVGHETDFTISDFVADKRAATPSEAAVMACSPMSEQINKLNYQKDRMVNNMQMVLKDSQYLFLKNNSSIMERAMVDILNQSHTYIDNSLAKMHNKIKDKMEFANKEFEKQGHKLDTLSPIKTFDRGYSIAMSGEDVLTDVNQVNLGDSIDIIVKNGIIKCNTVSKKEGRERE